MEIKVSEKILSCPYCGKGGEGIVYVIASGCSYAVYCDNCSAQGISMLQASDAVKYWNEVAALKLRSGGERTTNSVRKAIAPSPTIVCLCGSTRFLEAFREANLRETLAGKIVLSIGCDFKSDHGLGLTDADKEKLDILHLRKIDLADEVLILNVNGYIGKSTRKELDYALINNKRVRYLEALQLP